MTRKLIDILTTNKQWIFLSSVLLVAVFIGFLLSTWFLQPDITLQPPGAAVKQEQLTTDISEKSNSQQSNQITPTPTSKVTDEETEREMVDNNARVISPELQPNWAKGTAPMQRVKGIEIEEDPSRKTARRYEGTIVLGAGLYKLRYGRAFIKIQIDTVSPLSFREQCRLANGDMWHCGGWARRQVANILQFKPLECNIDLPAKVSVREVYPAQCWLYGSELAHILVREGWASPKNTNNDTLNRLTEEAKRLGKGVWRQF
ncbi:MAG: hypothetical protein OIF56_15115 [Cohaesibacter sp.]|nr:hypothetical protein [Cohaesibacter sp.]